MATTKKTTTKKTADKKTATKKTASKKPAVKKQKSIRDHKIYGTQCAYILDCIKDKYIEDENKKRPTDKELIDYAINRFDKESNSTYNKRMYRNIQDRIQHWLSGLALPVDFTYEDIIKLGKKWGYCNTEKQSEQFVDRWFGMLALRMIQTWEYYNKPQSIYQKLG